MTQFFSAAHRFLTMLFAGKPQELYILLCTLPENQSHWFRNVDKAIQFAESMREHDLYVGIGLTGRDYGLTNPCLSSEFAGIVGFCAVLNLKSDAHPQPCLPETPAQALSILPPAFPPTIEVRTGSDLQVWWLFREPYLIQNNDDRRAASALMNRWHGRLRAKAQKLGLTYQGGGDLAQVLRVPGTTNCKDPANPKSVVIELLCDRRYNPSELADYMDELTAMDAEAEAATARESASRGAPVSETRRFLEALFSDKPDDLYILIWTRQESRILPDEGAGRDQAGTGHHKRSRWFRDTQRAIAFVDSTNGCDVYVGIGLSPSDFGEYRRCESPSVAGIVGLWIDFDLRSDAHPRGTRPATIEEALLILSPEFPPSFVIGSGNGIQVWWLLKEPLIFANEQERQSGATLASRWQTLFKYAAQRQGWVFESLGDLARVLRVPGTRNLKDPANPKLVVIRTSTDRRYNASDFIDYLDDLAIPNEDERARDAKQWTDRYSDKPPVVSLSAAIPDEQLALWMQEDSRFSRTWNHQRDDMNDKSQSGYDLALANFAVRKGLTDQQIVNLIIHNRRLHGVKQCQRPDYFHRAISKARSGVSAQIIADTTVPADPGATTPSLTNTENPGERTEVREPDPHEKAKLCEQISAILGVQILRIEKLIGSEPVYLMELACGGIEFSSVGKLLSAKVVREAIAARTGKLIRKFRTGAWDQIAQMILNACTDKEGTDDLEFKGVARIHITKYLSDHPPVALDRLAGPNVYGPLIAGGRITISSTDLKIYINKTTMENMSVKRVAAMIAAVGGEPVRIRKNSFNEQSRWALPVGVWNPKDYSTGAGEFSNAR